jgi:hypothetical protein
MILLNIFLDDIVVRGNQVFLSVWWNNFINLLNFALCEALIFQQNRNITDFIEKFIVFKCFLHIFFLISND